MSIHVFAGLTVAVDRIRELLPGAVTHPPVRHGDLLRLGAVAGDTVVLIDGLWHQSAPVRHKEILVLLADRVTVVGAASMGALRAAELAPYGMIGIGTVYQDFRTGVLDADDEVAVLHTPDGRALSQALVNIRAAVRRTARAGRITGEDAAALEQLARTLPYTRRTWAALGRAAAGAGVGTAFERVNVWRRTNAYDVKREDAEAALVTVAAGLPRPPTAMWAGEPWRTSFVRYWQAASAAVGTVPFLAVLQYQQLYDPGFPARWRARVVAAVAGRQPGTSDDMEAAALRLAAAEGVDPAAMTLRQLEFWLTPRELRDLDRGERLIRMMVRSARLDGAWSLWPTTTEQAGDLLDHGSGTAEAVAGAFAVNDAVERADPGHSTDKLSTFRIADHLVRRWALPPDVDRALLDAAARDRAFRDFAGAVEVARAFYLGARDASTTSSAAVGATGVMDSQRT